jgi:hypothetical protein
MPKNKVSDPITDQEIAFARWVLSGAMTDRPAAVQQQLVQQEADLSRLSRPAVERAVDGQRRLNPDREQVLARLWEIANLSPEITRGSVTGQVKALSMIIAMENFIPDRRTVAAEMKSASAINTQPQIYAAAWRRKQATTIDPQPNPAPVHEEDGPGDPKPAPGSAGEAPPDPGPSQSTFANRRSPSEAPPLMPYAPGFRFVPDARGPFSNIKNPFVRPR